MRTWIDIIGLLASIEELASLREHFQSKNPEDYYVKALEHILEDQSRHLRGSVSIGPEEKYLFRRHLARHSIDLGNLPPIPDVLDAEIGSQVSKILIDVGILTEDDGHRAGQIVQATHRTYSSAILDSLPNQTIFVSLAHLGSVVVEEGRQQEARILAGLGEILEEIRTERRFPGEFVTREKIAPYNRPSREVVVGRTATIAHIRDQRFMERPRRLDEALGELDRHLELRAAAHDPEVYTFWIDGRSGCGKSVLLLQLLQKLVIERSAPVVWLDDAGEDLYPFLRAWADNPSGTGSPIFVFVDDFYSPQNRDHIDFRAIARLLRGPSSLSEKTSQPDAIVIDSWSKRAMTRRAIRPSQV